MKLAERTTESRNCKTAKPKKKREVQPVTTAEQGANPGYIVDNGEAVENFR